MAGSGPDCDDQAVAVLWWDLGRELAALRREAGLTQHGLAALVAFSRPVVSMAEIGRGYQARQFWEACDKALDTGGVLAAGADQVGAVVAARRRAAVVAAQREREARALAAFAAARESGGVEAGVNAVRPCPNCGCGVMVLTTLISGDSES